MLRLSHQLRDNCSVLLSISIGNAKHTGAEFTEIVNLIEQTRQIREGAIMLTGALQRHNIRAAHSVGEDEALQLAMTEEERWLERNNEALQRLLNLNFNIIKWENLLQSNGYKLYYDQIIELNRDSGDFRRAIEQTVRNFSLKYSKNSVTMQKQCLTHVQQYLLEECAMVPFLSTSNEFAFDYEFYYGKQNRPLQIARKTLGFSHRMLFIEILEQKIEQNENIKKDEFMITANALIKSFSNKLTPDQRNDFISSLACFCARFNEDLEKTIIKQEEYAK